MHDFWIAVAGGIATAAALWAITRLVSPRVRWTEGIAMRKSETAASGLRYWVQLTNRSPIRSIVDLRLRGELVIKALDPEHSNRWFRIPLSMTAENVPQLKPRVNRLIYLDFEHVDSLTLDRVRDIGLSDKETILSPGRRLQQVMAMREEAFVIIGVLAKDGWSGREVYCESPLYRASDIKAMQFKSEGLAIQRDVLRGRRRLGEFRSHIIRTQKFNRSKPTNAS